MVVSTDAIKALYPALVDRIKRATFEDKRFVLYDRARVPVERHDIFDAACKEYSAGDWDNDSDDFRMERVVLSIRYFERVPIALA